MTAGYNEPTNKEFVRIFVSESDWNEAVETGARIIGVLAVDPHLLPEGIQEEQDMNSTLNDPGKTRAG